MNRRGFLGALGAFAAAPAIGAVKPDAPPPPATTPPSVCRADGKAFIVGIATETVHVGDYVQIQTRGPATIHVR